MGKYIDQLNARYEPDKLVKSVNTVNTGESDFKTHGSIFDTDTLDTLHSVSTLTVANTPHRKGKNKFATLDTLDTLKAADELKISKWLIAIKETDQDIIDELLSNCCTNPKLLKYCLERADEPMPIVVHTGNESWVE